MDLSFAPAIRVFGAAGGTHKYILIKITLGDGTHHFCIRSGNGYAYDHAAVLCETRTEFHPLTSIEVLGGGFITMRKDLVMVTGKSQTYGPAPRDVVAEILRRTYPTHEINIENAPTQP